MKLFRNIEVEADGQYSVGDVISFTLTDGEEVEALAVKQERDGMIFILLDCMRKEYRMNHSRSNRGGYKKSVLRKTLCTKILERFPSEIHEKMIAFDNGGLLRLPTEREIFGLNSHGETEPENVEQWEPMKNRHNRIAFLGKRTNKLEWYWLQNKGEGSSAYFSYVYDIGFASSGIASDPRGVRPVFKI